MRLFRLLSWPYLRRHFLRWSLTIAGIALGVAVFVAMRAANDSVHEAFVKTVDQVAGSTQLQIWAGEFGFDESVLEKAQSVREAAVAVPVIEATVETGSGVGSTEGGMLILGVDMTGDRSLRDYELDSGDESIIDDPLVFLAQPDSLLVTREFAERNHYTSGSKVTLYTLDGEKQFTIRGVMNSGGLTRAFGGNLAIMDVYAAQAVFGRGRRFDRIDLKCADGVSIEPCRKALMDALGPGFEVEPPSSRGQRFEALMGSYTRATAISSLFALVVGMFIIFNSFQIAVTHRRAEIGVLRALGATEGQVRRVFLMESLIAGLAGSALGAAGGAVLAMAIARYMGAITEQVAGVAQRVDEISLDPLFIAGAIALGVVTSVIAAWIPARAASRVDPVQALQKGKFQTSREGESRARRIVAAVAGLLSLVALAGAAWKPAFYAAYLLMIVAALAIAPTLAMLVARAIRPVFRAWLPAEGALAADSLIQAPRRTAATVSALMLSLAMVIGFGGMTRSIYTALTDWLDTALNPDFFVTPSANLTARAVTFPESVGAEIEAVPGVEQVQLVRNARVMVNGVPVMVVSVEAAKLATKVFRKPIEGDIETMHRLTAAGQGVIVSDGFQANLGVRSGDMVELPTPHGILRLPVVGIVRDYSDMLGSVFIDRQVYRAWWDDDTVNIARVYVKKGEDVQAVREQTLRAISKTKRLLILSNDDVRAYVMRLTDQWFAVTYNQIFVAIVVAMLGIVNTLTVSITDRRRELGVMQAVGGLRRQVRRAVWLEAVAIGVIGLALGLALGAINVYYTLGMVRRDLGGLDLDYVFPVALALTMIPAILGAAFLAALGPAESAVRGELVNALEYE